MNRAEFIDVLTGDLWEYINHAHMYGNEAKIRVNPELKFVEIESEKDFLKDLAYSQEVIENAAYAHDAAQYEAEDFQASQNPEFYPAKDYLTKDKDGKTVPDAEKIARLADTYFPE